MIRMTLNCVKLTQTCVIRIIYRNVRLRFFLFANMFVSIVMYVYFIYI